MPDKDEWVAEIESLALDFQIADSNMGLKSPQFTYRNWRIGTDKKKEFNAVVLRWLADPSEQPAPMEGWLVCPPSDKRKKWGYRVRLGPHQLRSLLMQLDSLARSDESWYREFEARVRSSQQDSPQRRRGRLANAPKFPRKVEVTTTIYERNPDVVAEVLLRANGTCEDKECRAPAPFTRRSDGTPYLEVHHKTPLSVGGEDSVENAIALCPNCHRRLHYA